MGPEGAKFKGAGAGARRGALDPAARVRFPPAPSSNLYLGGNHGLIPKTRWLFIIALMPPKEKETHLTIILLEVFMKKQFKPGQTVPDSGQYKNTGTKTEVTAVKGEPFPPTPKPGQKYVLVDKTKHK